MTETETTTSPTLSADERDDVVTAEVVSYRLHPASLLLSFLGHAKSLILPALVVLLLASGDRWQVWFAVLVVPAMVAEVYRYFSLRFRIDRDELIVTVGFFFKNERNIPLARIQNIDLVQGVIARALGVGEVRIETASGSEPEAVFKVLSLRDVEEIRTRIRHKEPRSRVDSAGDATAESEFAAEQVAAARDIYRLTGAEVLRLGIDPGRGVAMIAGLFAFVWEFGLGDRIDLEDRLRPVIEGASEWMPSIALVFAIGLAFMLLVCLLSIGWALVRFYGYQLQSEGDQFRIKCGLLTRLSATIPKDRIQFVSVSESPFMRWMGRVTIRVETAGGANEETESLSRRWFVPIVRTEDSGRILNEIHPDYHLEGLDWQPLAPKAGRRMRKKAIIASILLTTIATAAAFPYGAISGLICFPLFLVGAAKNARFTGWCRSNGVMFHRSGGYYRSWGMVRPDCVQVVNVAESPFDRRYGMATLIVDTAGSSEHSHPIQIKYLVRQTAVELERELTVAAERAGFHWASDGERAPKRCSGSPWGNATAGASRWKGG